MIYRRQRDEAEKFFAELDSLPDEVRTMMRVKAMLSLWYHLDLVKQCESPIEQMLAIPLVDQIEELNRVYFRSKASPFTMTGYYIEIVAQKEIEIDSQVYRADFLIYIHAHEDWPSVQPVIVECDGHDYHDRTKEQASRDRERDRKLQAAGYHVLRYTGSDIWRDPDTCARDIRSFVERIIDRAIRKRSDG